MFISVLACAFILFALGYLVFALSWEGVNWLRCNLRKSRGEDCRSPQTVNGRIATHKA